MPYYVAGYYINNKAYNNQVKKNTILRLLFIIFWITSVVLVGFRGCYYLISKELVSSNYVNEIANQLLQLFIAFSWIAIIVNHKEMIKNKCAFFGTVGAYSLDLYALQVCPTILLRKAQVLFAMNPILDAILCVIVTICISVILICLSKYVIRKNKYTAALLLGRR